MAVIYDVEGGNFKAAHPEGNALAVFRPHDLAVNRAVIPTKGISVQGAISIILRQTAERNLAFP